MDIMDKDIRLHPLAGEYLFKYYGILRRIFSQVLGQLEIDYLSIGLIDNSGQLFLFSSQPSVEQNLIEKNLLLHDESFRSNFVYQDRVCFWSDLNNGEYKKYIYQYKQLVTGLKKGISIPSQFGDYKVVFSFGFKSQGVQLNQDANFLSVGKYCLREIVKAIPLPNPKGLVRGKPHLELIINNKVIYEKTS